MIPYAMQFGFAKPHPIGANTRKVRGMAISQDSPSGQRMRKESATVRRESIASELRATGEASTSDISAFFDMSIDQTKRDLVALEKAGTVSRRTVQIGPSITAHYWSASHAE